MARLFATIIMLLASLAWCDSIYILGTLVNPDGRGDFFDQKRANTTFDSGNLDDFGATFGYDHFLGEYINIGGSVSYYSDDATAADRAFRLPDGRPVVRDFRLKLIPIEFNVSVLPVGRNVPVIPFVGGGIGLYLWEYEEAGDFVIDRNSNPRIVSGSAFSDGSDFGFHVHGGIQIPFSHSAVIYTQVKHSWVEDDISEDFDRTFEPIDLSVITYSVGLSFWF